MSLDIELPDIVDEQDLDAEFELHSGVRKYVQMFADRWFSSTKRVAMTACVVMACFGVVFWNLGRLSIIDELVAVEVEEYRLVNQLADLEVEMSKIDMAALEEQIERNNDKVFQGFPELAAWAEQLAALALRSDIELSYRVQPPHLSAVAGVLEVPVLLEFKADDEAADKLFKGSMGLLGTILKDHWHIDVVSTRATGNGDHLLAMNVQAQVWVLDRFGFVDLESLPDVEADEGDIEPDDEHNLGV